MEEKKKPEVDNDKVKRSLTIIGLNYVAGLVLAVFTYGQVNIQDDLKDRAVDDEDQDYEYVEGLGDLDQCNGRFGVTPEFPEGIYYYVVTDDFPFFTRCLKGDI